MSRTLLGPGLELDHPAERWVRSADNTWWHPRTRRYPNTHQLLPGDVLLFIPRKPSLFQRGIIAYQLSQGAPAEHARVTHAALYVGLDHIICEATRANGVGYSPLDLRLDKYSWLVRRWPGLTLAQRQRIVAMAAHRLGQPYNSRSIFAEVLHKGAGQKRETPDGGLVCSRLVDRSIIRALLELGLDADKIAFSKDWVTPAILSETKRLEDVDFSWRHVG